MSVNATVSMGLTVRETLETNVPAAESPVVTHNQFNFTGTLKSDTSVPATKTVADSVALTAGAATLDLTDLEGTNGATVDATGLKLQAIMLHNPITNTGNMIVKPGASNPYDFFGDADGQITLKPGDRVLKYSPDKVEDVDGTHCEIDIAGTGTESLNVQLLFG